MPRLPRRLCCVSLVAVIYMRSDCCQRPVTNEILVETQVGVPKDEIKYFDNILEKEVVK